MDLKKAIAKAIEDAEAIEAKAAADGDRDMTEAEQAEFKGLLDNAESWAKMVEGEAKDVEKKNASKARLAAIKGVTAAADDEADDTESKDIEGADDDLESKGVAGLFEILKRGATQPLEEKSLGQRFVESPEYKAALEDGGGLISGEEIISMKAEEGVEFKNLVTTTVAADSLSTQVRVDAPTPKPRRLLSVMNTAMKTTRDSLRTNRAIYTRAAAETAEGAVKPEADLTFTPFTENVRKIAVSIPVTEEALSDHDYMRGLIDTLLVDDVLDEVEATSAAWLATLSGVLVQAFDTDLYTSLRRGITLGEDLGTPTGILMNNVDKADLDLIRGSDQHFIGGGPHGGGAGATWDLPVPSTSAIAAGFAYIGALNRLQWVERSPVTIRTGWVNNQFRENELTILAETRGMNDVLKPGEIVKVATAA